MPVTTASNARRRSRVRVLKTFDQINEALGGTNETAAITGRTASQVCKWRARYGVFPAELFPIIEAALAERGLAAPYELFRFDRVA